MSSFSRYLFFIPYLEESMENKIYNGFEISAYQHSASSMWSHQFRKGIWYGTIDRFAVTAPCIDKERAIKEAQHCLENGSHLAGLRTLLATYKNWLKGSCSAQSQHKALQELPKIEQQIEKVLAFMAAQAGSS